MRTLLIVVALVAGGLLALRLLPAGKPAGGQEPPAASREPSSRAADGDAGEGILERPRGAGALVHVAGAVRRPGVYRVGSEARVRDAVRRAGGARAAADLDAINLAAKLSDGQQVVVPLARTAGGAGAGATGAGGAASGLMSLGSATAQELDTLDGIGPVTAQKIVEWRTKNGGVGRVEELDQVPGIGPMTIESLRGQLAP